MKLRISVHNDHWQKQIVTEALLVENEIVLKRNMMMLMFDINLMPTVDVNLMLKVDLQKPSFFTYMVDGQ